MLRDYVWHGMTMEKQLPKTVEDKNCPFNQFRQNEEKFEDEMMMGEVVEIVGDDLEQSGEDFVDALYREARRVDGGTKVKKIRAKALRALARQTQNYLGRMGYKLISPAEEWTE